MSRSSSLPDYLFRGASVQRYVPSDHQQRRSAFSTLANVDEAPETSTSPLEGLLDIYRYEDPPSVLSLRNYEYYNNPNYNPTPSQPTSSEEQTSPLPGLGPPNLNMPPAVGRMHPSHMSNPFANLNPSQNSVPQQGSHYPSQSHPFNANGAPTASTGGFTGSTLNGGISPFAPSGSYGGSAFGAGTGSASFGTAGMVRNQGQGLASVAAQQGFARGAAMQEHTAHQADAASMGMKSGAAGRIREVWRHNLEAEMAIIRQLILKYPYVSMVSASFSHTFPAIAVLTLSQDAEFPGIVARPIGNFAGSKAEYHYQTLRCNVDILKPIQLGITLWSTEGDLPPHQADPSLLPRTYAKSTHYQNNLMYIPCTWVFNFEFDLENDMYSTPSIELLTKSGVNFQKHTEQGIDLNAFGATLMDSGLVFMEDVNWLSFHSGYDFGYLIKLLSADALPAHQDDFFDKVRTFFPKLWDIKFLLRHAQRLRAQNQLSPDGVRVLETLGQKSGLQDLADELGCQRIGPAHTGGSDAWLTGSVFWAMRQKMFKNNLPIELADQIYGLHGVPAPASQQYRDEFFAAQSTTSLPNGVTAAAASSGLQGGTAAYTPNHNPSTPTNTHAGLNNTTPGPGGVHFGPTGTAGGGFGDFRYGGK